MKNMLIVLSTIIALGLLYVGVTQPAQRSSVEMALVPVIYRLKKTVFQITCHAAKRFQRSSFLT